MELTDEKVGLFDARTAGSGDHLIARGDGFHGGLALELAELFDAVGEPIKLHLQTVRVEVFARGVR